MAPPRELQPRPSALQQHMPEASAHYISNYRPQGTVINISNVFNGSNATQTFALPSQPMGGLAFQAHAPTSGATLLVPVDRANLQGLTSANPTPSPSSNKRQKTTHGSHPSPAHRYGPLNVTDASLEAHLAKSRRLLQQVCTELGELLEDEALDKESIRFADVTLMKELAAGAEVATTENSSVLVVSADVARTLLRDSARLPGPLLVQPETDYKPSDSIEEVIEVVRGLVTGLEAQDCSQKDQRKGVKKVALQDVLTLMSSREEPLYPLNFLVCHPPRTTTSIPAFAPHINANYLDLLYDNRVRRTKSKENTRRPALRKKDPAWWRTFAQAGSLTKPHMDANGWGTVLTCARGTMLIFLLDEPTEAVFDDYLRQPQELPAGGRWRLVVLEEGWSVVMDPGTVHAVARLRGAAEATTLTSGHHFLKQTQVARMAELCELQIGQPGIINEDEIFEALPYLIFIAQEISAQRGKSATWADAWGGEEAVQRFWQCLARIDRRLIPELIGTLNAFKFTLPSRGKQDESGQEKPSAKSAPSSGRKRKSPAAQSTRRRRQSGPQT